MGREHSNSTRDTEDYLAECRMMDDGCGCWWVDPCPPHDSDGRSTAPQRSADPDAASAESNSRADLFRDGGIVAVAISLVNAATALWNAIVG